MELWLRSGSMLSIAVFDERHSYGADFERVTNAAVVAFVFRVEYYHRGTGGVAEKFVQAFEDVTAYEWLVERGMVFLEIVRQK